MSRRLRMCFIGDSFVQGIGDPDYRGRVGRVLAAARDDITAFNLGIGRSTSEDVMRRCWQEVGSRTLPDADNRLVISFGSSGAVEEGGRVRVAADRCLGNLASILDGCRRRAIAPLVVGTPPVIGAGTEHLRRTSRLADEMAALCRSRGVPFIGTTEHLAVDPVWTREAMADDGAHPGSGGYERPANLMRVDQWHEWANDTGP
ncbi:GDSL-type esterase/lipase family protein [Streptomyces tropicalis]|uniref:GDSL-type esterase/lipase family protein n=1 Tax=Streptomyces tropicalis TaxID=3034234 RepID=A0ABT6ACX7_9ACTN|nr:GDSL-type esterase/lipase family protein [Streptomyces tropicalis]MDF3302507.1 GDSL-type esterase/lipase family protein [Streptomyces tropicalis]